MRSIAAIILFALSGLSAAAQTTITNGGFENWGNTVPAGDTCTEPTGWYSNQSGSSTAKLGGKTCFKDNTIVHSGSYSVRVVTISGPFSTVINGVVTTGVVNAPTINKTDGYIGTVNYSTPSDDRRMSFTGRPDSLVGWYQYTSVSGERGKIRAILHTGDYYDPETPTTNHPDPTANKIADLTFFTPTSSVSTWTRFSMPFTYISASSPAYIMINVTPSSVQATTTIGSTMWIDDLQAVYISSGCSAPTGLTIGSITSNSAVLNWTATGAIGSEYVVNTVAADPATPGTGITASTYTATGLSPATLYYAHVRDSCGAASLSAWATTSFTTNPTGINSIAHGDLGIATFPNPVKDELTIRISGAASVNGQVQLMDISGRLIKTIVADAGTLNMSMNGLPSGVYLLRYTGPEHTQTIRINKQ